MTDRAGDVAVHTARARGGLSVTSVAAAPDVAPSDVLAVAHHLAVGEATGMAPSRRSLFDLPLGDGPAWTIREGDPRAGGREERCTAVVPAWSACTDHDLLADRRLGFTAAAAGLISLLPQAGYRVEAQQTAAARYSRVGFEAAAVTAMAVSVSHRVRPAGPPRTADLRFGHPYAVVAVTIDEWDPTTHTPVYGGRGTVCRCSPPGSPNPTTPLDLGAGLVPGGRSSGTDRRTVHGPCDSVNVGWWDRSTATDPPRWSSRVQVSGWSEITRPRKASPAGVANAT